jgi:SAM-dependent methyltransferase
LNEVEKLFADGEAYARRMGRWGRVVGEVFLNWLSVPNGLRWIDVGCGNGAFTEVLIARCAPGAVSAVDPSEGMVSYARARAGAKLAEFRIADAQALPYPDRSFDAAAMALAISFVPDPVKAAREMARVVRPGGWVATYMWDLRGVLRWRTCRKGCGSWRSSSASPSARPVWQSCGRRTLRDNTKMRSIRCRRFIGNERGCDEGFVLWVNGQMRRSR